MTNDHRFPAYHLAATVLIASVLLGLSYQQRLDWFTSPISIALTPLQLPFYQLRSTLDNQIDTLKSLPHQQRLITDLQRRNNELALLAQEAAQLKKENQALKALLASPVTPDHSVVSTRITGLSRFAALNQGSTSGIKLGQAVVVENILLGVISQVGSHTAQVRLLTDPDTDLPVTTLNGVTGQLKFSQDSLKITQVPQKDTLTPQQPVFTRGHNLIPEGLLVGTIKQIVGTPSDVYQTALITPATTITDHSTVFVILE